MILNFRNYEVSSLDSLTGYRGTIVCPASEVALSATLKSCAFPVAGHGGVILKLMSREVVSLGMMETPGAGPSIFHGRMTYSM